MPDEFPMEFRHTIRMIMYAQGFVNPAIRRILLCSARRMQILFVITSFKLTPKAVSFIIL
jgi:hypothetical protein